MTSDPYTNDKAVYPQGQNNAAQYQQQAPVHGYAEHQQYQQAPPQQYQQPPPQQNMAQQQQMQYQAQATGGSPRNWESGLFSCFDDMGDCCLTCCCPCITYSKIQYRQRHPDMTGYSTFNGPCIAFYAATCFGAQWILGMIQRGDIRAKYALEGSGTSDCCTHYWCGCCALIQENKETALRKSQETNTTGYAPQQQGMSYQPA